MGITANALEVKNTLTNRLLLEANLHFAFHENPNLRLVLSSRSWNVPKALQRSIHILIYWSFSMHFGIGEVKKANF